MRKRIISLVCLLAVGVIVARPPEFIRILERQGLAKLVADGRLDLARWAAWGMSLQNDAIGSSNYHALAFHHAVPAGGKVRKSVSRAADLDFQPAIPSRSATISSSINCPPVTDRRLFMIQSPKRYILTLMVRARLQSSSWQTYRTRGLSTLPILNSSNSF